MFLTKTIIHLVLLVIWFSTTTSYEKKGASKKCDFKGEKKFHMDPYIKLNWFDAYMHCRAMGWRLATIENKQENDDFLAYIRTKYPANSTQNDLIWLGATELAQVGSWSWMTTGHAMTFTDWLVGQPDNPVVAHCLSLWMFRWNDAVCARIEKFACEYVV